MKFNINVFSLVHYVLFFYTFEFVKHHNTASQRKVLASFTLDFTTEKNFLDQNLKNNVKILQCIMNCHFTVERHIQADMLGALKQN